MSKYSEFMEHVGKAINKDIYMWGGGQPQLWTLGELTNRQINAKETSTANVNRVKKLLNERKNKYPKAYAADCSGGIIYCMMLAGIVPKSFDDTANGLLNRCKKLANRSQLRVGDWVGQRNNTNTFHIGIVYKLDDSGQIWIAEWRGRDRGMVLTRIEDGASTWNRYGRPDAFYIASGSIETPGETTPSPMPAPNWELARLLKYISPFIKGNDVHNAQLALIGAGLNIGSTGADGVFGFATSEAVKSFQRKNGLNADGVIGKETCEALGGKWNLNAPSFVLTRLIKQTSPITTGDDVAAIQNALIRRNYNVGTMQSDGEFGKNTKVAVIAFQRAVGLNADGIVGKDTAQALNGLWNG